MASFWYKHNEQVLELPLEDTWGTKSFHWSGNRLCQIVNHNREVDFAIVVFETVQARRLEYALVGPPARVASVNGVAFMGLKSLQDWARVRLVGTTTLIFTVNTGPHLIDAAIAHGTCPVCAGPVEAGSDPVVRCCRDFHRLCYESQPDHRCQCGCLSTLDQQRWVPTLEEF